jgi:hypothetical protein
MIVLPGIFPASNFSDNLSKKTNFLISISNNEIVYFPCLKPRTAAVSSFHHGDRFLLLGCEDGLIRVLDTIHGPPYPILTLPGQGKIKTMTCMKVVGERVIVRLHFQLFFKENI